MDEEMPCQLAMALVTSIIASALMTVRLAVRHLSFYIGICEDEHMHVYSAVETETSGTILRLSVACTV